MCNKGKVNVCSCSSIRPPASCIMGMQLSCLRASERVKVKFIYGAFSLNGGFVNRDKDEERGWVIQRGTQQRCRHAPPWFSSPACACSHEPVRPFVYRHSQRNVFVWWYIPSCTHSQLHPPPVRSQITLMKQRTRLKPECFKKRKRNTWIPVMWSHLIRI